MNGIQSFTNEKQLHDDIFGTTELSKSVLSSLDQQWSAEPIILKKSNTSSYDSLPPPLAIFWDVEALPLPLLDCTNGNEQEYSSDSSVGAIAAHRLNKLLASQCNNNGYNYNLQLFRGYTNIGWKNPPQVRTDEPDAPCTSTPSAIQQRLDFQRCSGCKFVECPPDGERSMADKMILVDALEFAYKYTSTFSSSLNHSNNMDGNIQAVLCFITRASHVAYLLTKLSENSAWRTILISSVHDKDDDTMMYMNGTTSSKSKRLFWETDILQQPVDATSNPSRSIDMGLDKKPLAKATAVQETNDLPTAHYSDAQLCIPKISSAGTHSNDSAKMCASVASAESATSVSETSINNTSQGGLEVGYDRVQAESLTELEPRSEKIAMIHSAIVHAPPTARREEGGCLKSFVGQFLKTSYPSRFPHREEVANFLSEAIEIGLVQESGIGAHKVLSIIRDRSSSSSNGPQLMEATAYPPVSVDLLSKKTQQLASTKWPFMLFISRGRIDRRELPAYLIVLPNKNWIILMFKKLKFARSAVSETPALKFGFLVDWRKIHSRQEHLQRATEEEAAAAAAEKEERRELTSEESNKQTIMDTPINSKLQTTDRECFACTIC